MDLGKTIKRNYRIIEQTEKDISKVKRLWRERVDRLEPLVLEHFNEYLDSSINIGLPIGFKIQPAEEANNYGNGFVINLERINLPEDQTYEPEQLRMTVEELLNKYITEIPWVLWVRRDYGKPLKNSLSKL